MGQPWEDDQSTAAVVHEPKSEAVTRQPWDDPGAPPASSTTVTQSAPSLRDPDWISKYIYHPAIVGTGMTVGGAAGGALGTAAEPGLGTGLGAVAGASAMYGPSNNAANAIDAMRGMQSPSPSEGMIGDMGTGAEVEAGGKVLGAAIKAASPVVKAGIIKGIKTVFGPSEEAINAWLENPKLPTSDDVVALARKVPQTINKLKGIITQADDQAGKLLSDSPLPQQGAIPKDNLLNLIDKERSNLETTPGVIVGTADQAAADHLDALKNSISQLPGDHVPETAVHKLLQRVSKNINFADKSVTPTNEALANFRSGASQILKKQSQPYADAMEEIHDLLNVHDSVISDLGLTNQIGAGLQPSNQTISALQGLNKATKSITQDHLSDLAKLTGDDYVKAAQNAKYAEEFRRGSPNGSRRVNWAGGVGSVVGSGVGWLTGHPVIGAATGLAAGETAGAIGDTYGGPLAGVAADLVKALSPHMPGDVAARIVSSVLTPRQLQGNQ
jgi:hypothetical protein